MKIIGLCGMSGSGKGSVGVIFRQFSIPVLDTDRLYHSLIEDADSECTKLIIQEFGEAVADEQGRIDRKILRSLVFAPDAKEKLARLNVITHACVRKPPQTPKRTGFRELPGWCTRGDAGRVVSTGRALKLRPLSPHLALCISSLWLFLT